MGDARELGAELGERWTPGWLDECPKFVHGFEDTRRAIFCAIFPLQQTDREFLKGDRILTRD